MSDESKNVLNDGKLTDDDIQQITEELDEAVKGSVLENIAQFPSNTGCDERKPEDISETGEFKKMNVMVDENSGEQKILSPNDDGDIDFDALCKKMEESGKEIEISEITEDELKEYINNPDDGSMVKELKSEFDLSDDAIKDLLRIANRKIAKEDFNTYKEFPQEIKDIINRHLRSTVGSQMTQESKQYRNMVSDMLINEFVTNISLNKMQDEFNKDIETMFNEGGKEIADSIVGYTEERNKKYREYADGLDDEEKKAKIYAILDNIDDAYSLESLKEFSKRCKIKAYEFERPEKVFKIVLSKYINSEFSIYDINMARPILFRNLNLDDPEAANEKDVNAFFIAFCKQCLNMSPNNTAEHAYMYYLIYNVVLMDINKSDEYKHVSDGFKKNVFEVINNLKERNHF